jgi:transposase
MNSIGLDISKSTINVYIPINDSDIVINNDIKGLKTLYSKLKKQYKKEIDKLVFVFEPTSNYSFLTTKFCAQKKIQAFIVNPKQSANFMKAIGQRSKTDINDARMLCKMISTAEQQDIKVPIVDNVVEEIKELITYYNLILKQQKQNKNHLESISSKSRSSLVIRTIKQEIQSLEKKQSKLIVQIKEIIAKDTKLLQTFKNIQTIKGIGEISAIVLLHHFLKYPDANKKEIVSLAGLEPIQRSSGSSVQGKSRISKAGSRLCRSTLFMAAMVSITYNKELKRFYERLKQNGKHTTVAQVAVMRKMVVLAHSLFKNGTQYDEKRYLNY